MLVHHSSKPYEVAAGEAAAHAREKLGALIETGRVRAGRVIEQVESQIPLDTVVAGKALGFSGAGDKVEVFWPDVSAPLHDHALRQVCERTGMPWKWADELRQKDWGRGLLAHDLTELVHHVQRRALPGALGQRGGAPRASRDLVCGGRFAPPRGCVRRLDSLGGQASRGPSRAC